MKENLICSTCKDSLVSQKDHLLCLRCQEQYPVIENIPVFIRKLNLDQVKNKQLADEETNQRLMDKITLSEDCYAELHQIMIRLFGHKVKFKRVLDIGCGEGFLSLNLLKYGNFAEEIYGLDISVNSLRAFRKNMQANEIEQKSLLICSTAEKIFLPDDYFDAVICHKFIHHLSLKPMLDEVQRILKSGGVFICFKEPYLNYFTTHFKRIYYTLINLFSFILKRIRNRDYDSDILCRFHTKKFLYSKKTIEDIARKKGFDTVVFSFSKALFPFVKMLIYPFRLRFSKLNIFFDDLLKLVQKIDAMLERVISKRFLQEMSFYLRKT